MKIDDNTAKAAYLLLDDYLDICLGLTKNEHQDIYEKHKALKKDVSNKKYTTDEFLIKDSEIFLEYMRKVTPS